MLGRRASIVVVVVATVAAVLAPAAVAQAPPTISGFSPASGVAGDTVTISGSNLDGATSVMIGRVAAAITADAADSIQATVPAAATTSVISVVTPGGKATTTRFLALLAAPSFSPASGPYGTVVTLSGSGFNASSAVDANGVPASIVKRSGSKLAFTWPQAAAGGPITVTNTSTPAGTITTSGSFTVTPHVARRSPPSRRPRTSPAPR